MCAHLSAFQCNDNICVWMIEKLFHLVITTPTYTYNSTKETEKNNGEKNVQTEWFEFSIFFNAIVFFISCARNIGGACLRELNKVCSLAFNVSVIYLCLAPHAALPNIKRWQLWQRNANDKKPDAFTNHSAHCFSICVSLMLATFTSTKMKWNRVGMTTTMVIIIVQIFM